MNFEISYSLFSHTKDVRALDCHNNILITGGTDNTVCIFNKIKDKYQQIMKSSIFQSYIYAVKVNPYNNLEKCFLVGCKDSKIYILDQYGTPVGLLQGHQSAVCSLSFYDSNTFVSGSWDGSANIWSLTQNKLIKSLKGHSHAVAVYTDQEAGLIITGSQDKNLNIWEYGTWKLLKKIEKAHGDIIREISPIPGVGFLTCSNDESIKGWTYEGEQMFSHLGHTAFVFTAKAKSFGQYYSGSDDKTIKVWNNDACVQTIGNTGSIWSLIIDQSGDIIIGSSDSIIRVFTKDANRKASTQDIQAFHNQCLKQNAKKAGMTPEQISKLPPVQKIALHKGKKEGEIKIFRQGNIPFAYSWKTTKWERIGQVITEGGSGGKPAEKRLYEGDKYFPAGEYDYIFEVDDQSGMPKVIPFNDGDNALQYAQKYCKREGLQKGYIEQIRKFLTVNSRNIPRQKMQVEQPLSSALEMIPQTRCIEFLGIANVNGLRNKLFEFNEHAVEKYRLNATDKIHLERFINLLEKPETYHTWVLDFKELDAFKKTLNWEQNYKLPVWDILRAYLNHYQSQTLFSSIDSGMDVLGPCCAALINPAISQALSGLIIRVFCNSFIQNTNRYSMIKNADILIEGIQKIAKRNFTGKTFLTVYSSLMLNYSVALLEKPIEKQEVVLRLIGLIQYQLTVDSTEQNVKNYLVAIGNIVHKYPNLKGNCAFAKKYLGSNQISRDLQRLIN